MHGRASPQGRGGSRVNHLHSGQQSRFTQAMANALSLGGILLTLSMSFEVLLHGEGGCVGTHTHTHSIKTLLAVWWWGQRNPKWRVCPSGTVPYEIICYIPPPIWTWQTVQALVTTRRRRPPATWPGHGSSARKKARIIFPPPAVRRPLFRDVDRPRLPPKDFSLSYP